jgi:hypothetical protein
MVTVEAMVGAISGPVAAGELAGRLRWCGARERASARRW